MKKAFVPKPVSLDNCAVSFDIDTKPEELENYGVLRGSVSIRHLSDNEGEDIRAQQIQVVTKEIEDYLLTIGYGLMTAVQFEDEYGTFVAVKREEPTVGIGVVVTGIGIVAALIYGGVKLFK